jgi:hypothetical protein
MLMVIAQPFYKRRAVMFAIAIVVVFIAAALYPNTNPGEQHLFPRTEDLAVKAAASPSGYLTITVSNRFTSPALIIEVTFNGSEVPVPPANITATGGFTTNANGTYSLPVGASGDFVIARAALGEVSSGTTYAVDVITVAGNSWLAYVTWS